MYVNIACLIEFFSCCHATIRILDHPAVIHAEHPDAVAHQPTVHQPQSPASSRMRTLTSLACVYLAILLTLYNSHNSSFNRAKLTTEALTKRIVIMNSMATDMIDGRVTLMKFRV